jgi:threonine dehydrogenase-like Zn-dependent dehydrogenase
MSTTIAHSDRRADLPTGTMRAAVFEGADRIVLEERPIPECGPTDAVVRVTMTTICGTDVHILRGEYPFRPAGRSSRSSTASGTKDPHDAVARAARSACAP